MTSRFKLSLLTTSLLVGVSAPAFAQDSGCEPGDTACETAGSPTGNTIIVTGSRIASPDLVSPSPLQIVDAQSIDDAGVTNIQDLLLENPVFGTPGLSRTNSAFLTSGTGVATVDLRDLGSDRTLVLINGRRVVAGLPGSSTVDLNVIPTQFIERIDILTGGASSLYGSDAIAGVVNFIYKQDFEGIDANGQYGLTQRGDDIRYQGNLTVGANTSDGRGNIMVHFGYSNEKGVLSRQRANTFTDDLSDIYFGGSYYTSTEFGTPFFSSFPTQGRFITSNGTFTYDPNGALQNCFTTNGSTCNATIGSGTGPNGFNRQFFRTIAVPVERYTFAASGHYDVSDDISLFFEGTFNKTSSSRIIEPFPLESGGANGIFPSGGGFNIENYLPGTSTIVANPLVPAEILAASTDTNGDGLRDIGFARRLAEFGPRSGSTERDFYRFVVGLEGGLFENKFRWDLSYNYGQTVENQVSSGQVNVVNFRDALAVMTDVNDVNGNGLTTDAICISAEARANGCSPANIFGAGSLSQAAVDYIAAQGTFQTSIKQHVVQGNISGSLFELPAGPLGIALGFEYRKEESSEDSDALTNAGLNAGNKIPDTRGQFDVIEGYGEIRIPILSDTPFFKLLEVSGSGRIADYSTVGTIYSYSGTVTWQPIEDIRLRGTYSRAVRAPNIGELFSGLSQTFPSGLQDPCVGVGATGGGVLGDTCRAAPGVAANIAANGTFTINQADIQGIGGFNGGNPNLFEETADTYTIGLVINPRSIDALRNFNLTVDYYNITVNDVISGFPRTFTLDQCYNSGNQTFCDLITRRPTNTAVNSAGSIDLINALQVNASKIETAGIDVTLGYSSGLSAFGTEGRISARLAYTHLFKYDYFALPNEAPDPQDGEVGTASDKFTANLAYQNDDVRLTFTGTYIGKSTEDQAFCAPDPAGCFPTSAQFYLDTQATFYASDHYEFYAGIDNVLDNDAPNLLSGTTYNVTGTDTAADVYDVFGRRFYAGVRLRF